MQTSAFGKSKGLWKTLTEGTWSDAFDGLGISLLLTSNPAIQVHNFTLEFKSEDCIDSNYYSSHIVLSLEQDWD